MKKRSSYGQPGRPTLTPSALIWAFRRGVVLVQMLAAGENEDSLRWLAGKWGVPTVGCDYPALVINSPNVFTFISQIFSIHAPLQYSKSLTISLFVLNW